MAGWTEKGKVKMLAWAFRGNALPTNYYVLLLQSNTAPTNATNYVANVVPLISGNGYYPGGYPLTLDTTDFDAMTQDASNARGYIQLKDIVWTGNGGTIPVNGTGARYAVLTNDSATQTDREVYCYWDLVSARTVSDGQTLTLQDCELRLNEA